MIDFTSFVNEFNNSTSDDIPKSDVLTVEHRRTIRNLFNEYTKSLTERTTAACADMNKVQKKVKRQERSRGERERERERSLCLSVKVDQ